MKKTKILMLGILTVVSVSIVVLIGCGNIGDEVPAKNVTITITNNSSDRITSYRVMTRGGLADSEHNYAYTSTGFVELFSTEELNEYSYGSFTKSNVPAFDLAAGATSGKLGPFKVPFRNDRANGSDIDLFIHLDRNTDSDRPIWWGVADYFEEEMPDSFNLVFDGSTLSKIN